MLSKLTLAEWSVESSSDRQALQQAIEQYFRIVDRAATVIPASVGTLGVCFHLELAGARRFLKTHRLGEEGRANLEKEADILYRLYGNTVLLDQIELQLDGGRLCLIMVELSPLTVPMSPEEAAAIVRKYTRRLNGYRPSNMMRDWDLEHYITHGRRAMATLADRSLIGKATAAELQKKLKLLETGLANLPRALCHGDFGPKNIMRYGARPIAIDWEDAFWGVAGYDYLYWLTFLDNRRFLCSSALGRTGLDPAVERALLALVVLLKSSLSVLSGTYLQNTIPIEVRIGEILALPEV
jgi:hypothetical protein